MHDFSGLGGHAQPGMLASEMEYSPRFPVGAHKGDKCVDLRRSNVLLQELPVVM